MQDNTTFSQLAILYELNKRESEKRLTLFPKEMQYYVILASSIIGAENAKHVQETPDAVIKESEGFVQKLLELTEIEQDVFRGVLETCLIEVLKDELRFNCTNCMNFNECIDLENLLVGGLFKRRVQGEETDELKNEIRDLIDIALQNTPFVNTDEAHRLCRKFAHIYSANSVAEVFGRYAEIAASLSKNYGIEYQKIQQQMIALNMEFYEKSKEQEKGEK